MLVIFRTAFRLLPEPVDYALGSPIGKRIPRTCRRRIVWGLGMRYRTREIAPPVPPGTKEPSSTCRQPLFGSTSNILANLLAVYSPKPRGRALSSNLNSRIHLLSLL